MRIAQNVWCAVAALSYLGSSAAFGQWIEAPQPNLTIASSHLPGWNDAALSGAYGAYMARPAQQRRQAPAFFGNRWNRTLVAADFGVRMLDAFSSWMDRPSNCPYCAPEMVLPQSWSNSLPTMLVFSTTVSATVDLSARFLWRRHHARLARIALLSDIAGDGKAGIGNLRVYAQARAYAATLRANRAAAARHR